jgi:D-arabinitol dehydrogenase (NADP+)
VTPWASKCSQNSLSAGRVFKIKNLSDVDATLLEPASCAAHGLDKKPADSCARAQHTYHQHRVSEPNPSSDQQGQQQRHYNPYGFDIVVEATGSQTILEDSINYVRRGGKLVVYGAQRNCQG